MTEGQARQVLSGCWTEALRYLHWIHTLYIVSCFPLFTCSLLSTRFWTFSSPAPVNSSWSSSEMKRKKEELRSALQNNVKISLRFLIYVFSLFLCIYTLCISILLVLISVVVLCSLFWTESGCNKVKQSFESSTEYWFDSWFHVCQVGAEDASHNGWSAAQQGTGLPPFLFTLFTSDIQYFTPISKFSDYAVVTGCISGCKSAKQANLKCNQDQ